MRNDFIVSSGGVMSSPMALREKWEEFNETSVPKYFDKSLKKFSMKIAGLSQLKRPLTDTEQKELRFMLEALIEANQTLYPQVRQWSTKVYMNKLIQRSLLNALGTIAYVGVVATLMQAGEKIFGDANQTTGPIAFLTLFVLSAGVTGGLVLGKPLLMYLDNEKTDAVKLFIYTLGWLMLAVIILFAVSIWFK